MGELETTGVVGNIRKIFTKSYSLIRNGVLIKFDERDLVGGKYVVPSSVIKIGKRSFEGCYNLQEIEISSSVKEIEDSAFAYCSSLTQIKLNEGLEVIGSEAFLWSTKRGDEKLIDLVIPDSVKQIGSNAFAGCSILKNLKISSNIDILNELAFARCENLETVEIPEGVEEIESKCFSLCHKLEKIVFPKSVKTLYGDVFRNSTNLKEVIILNDEIEIKGILDLANETKINIPARLIDKMPINVMTSGNLYVNGEKYKLPDRLKILSNETYKYLIDKYSLEEIRDIKLKGLNNVCKHIYGENYNTNLKDVTYLQIACYHLGVLGDDAQLVQVMGEFLKNLHDKHLLNSDILSSFAYMKKKDINKDFIIFFKDNYEAIFKILKETDEENIINLLVDIHDNFDELSKSFVSDNAAARQKKPTLEFFMKTLNKDRFGENIDEKYAGIAEEMLKFSFYTKEDFEKACGVYDKYLEFTKKKLPPSKKAISQCMERSFGHMERIEKSIEENLQEATANIGKSIAQEETWEWLEKNDPLNFTLGLYCNCCARIGGAGEGIAIASVLDPNVRNLVIKDKNGRPIAKATLYVNSEKGYALFNNFEVANGVREEKKPKVYQLLKEATNNFVKNYNKEAVERHIPVIKKVNVGMGLNDLEEFLSEKSTEILKGIDFSKYSKGNYPGDWMQEQYVFLNATSTQAKDVNNEDVTI